MPASRDRNHPADRVGSRGAAGGSRLRRRGGHSPGIREHRSLGPAWHRPPGPRCSTARALGIGARGRRQRARRPGRRGDHQPGRWSASVRGLGARGRAGVHRQAMRPSQSGRPGKRIPLALCRRRRMGSPGHRGGRGRSGHGHGRPDDRPACRAPRAGHPRPGITLRTGRTGVSLTDIVVCTKQVPDTAPERRLQAGSEVLAWSCG
jgi:hypothetical protein